MPPLLIFSNNQLYLKTIVSNIEMLKNLLHYYLLGVIIISLASSLAASLIHKIDSSLVRKALPHLVGILKIREVSLNIIESIFRKAARLGALKYLDPEERSLLIALRAFLKRYGKVRSEILIKILMRIYAKIEAHSLRGRAILIGILLRLRRGRDVEDPEVLLIEGLQFTNKPTPYRAL